MKNFIYPTWMTFKTHQGCCQLHIWGRIEFLPVRYFDIIIGPYHPNKHECLPQRSKTSTRPDDWVWSHFINPKFGPKTNPHQKRNNTPHHIIPLEINPSNKLKEPHRQVKCLSECSILHRNHIHPCLYIHPCFQVISMTIIEILHTISWFTRRNRNWVIVTLYGACHQNTSPITIPLEQDPGPHWYNKIVKKLAVGENTVSRVSFPPFYSSVDS